ncbi:hypothetical protein N9922_00160 [Cyclobacteriaceae bacterium]|jgi:hypothetical protein|nr:hypothetical protein [Cyclobacteriaceae bacterium]MDB4290605.1 hypothetical protein [Cyclobacteriaceae bacterium]MDB4603172.1 hypothetical protein [Cyclobacteriaceae bacterium]MDC6484009.1 hypothetical protein [Cyclobacteriaceae bacterium]|tara:strand:+ start:458 stop:1291 length:834 start_codon:yes stop_codon:yes gene_type:complete
MKYQPLSLNRISNLSPSLSQIIKNWGLFGILLLFVWSCENKASSSQKKILTYKGQEVIDQAIIAHGQNLFENATLSFSFRDKQYSARRSDTSYAYTRSFKDGSALIEDMLINSTHFSRKKNGVSIEVSKEWADKYSRSINSVLYFFQLPYLLNDLAVKKTDQGIKQIKGESYHQIKVSFQIENGGDDFEDEYLYWVNVNNYEIDYLAYNYITDGGGVRFRSAINKRRVDGLLVQDYINYAPVDKKMPLSDLITQFEKEALIERSRIINSEITLLSNN